MPLFKASWRNLYYPILFPDKKILDVDVAT